MNTAFAMQLIIGGVVLTWAAIHDLRHYTIPMYVFLLGVVAGLAAALVFNGWHGLLVSVIGGTLGGFLGWVLVRMTRLGEGDALLFLALGVIFGPALILYIFIWSNILVLLRLVVPVLKKQKIRIAVAPYILAGTFLALLIPTHFY